MSSSMLKEYIPQHDLCYRWLCFYYQQPIDMETYILLGRTVKTYMVFFKTGNYYTLSSQLENKTLAEFHFHDDEIILIVKFD